MPNWYVAGEGDEPRVLLSTSGEDAVFVGDIDTPRQWKRSLQDQYDPYTPEDRYSLQNYSDLGEAPALILPTPILEDLDVTDTVDIGTGDWVVVAGNPLIQPEADFLAGR